MSHMPKYAVREFDEADGSVASGLFDGQTLLATIEPGKEQEVAFLISEAAHWNEQVKLKEAGNEATILPFPIRP